MKEVQLAYNFNGHEIHCHVCWEAVYQLWVDSEPPEYDRCPVGNFTAQTCPNAIAGAQCAKRTALTDQRALELWREREMTFPERTRRMNPDDFDRASGAWATIRRQAFLEVLGFEGSQHPSDTREATKAKPGATEQQEILRRGRAL